MQKLIEDMEYSKRSEKPMAFKQKQQNNKTHLLIKVVIPQNNNKLQTGIIHLNLEYWTLRVQAQTSFIKE